MLLVMTANHTLQEAATLHHAHHPALEVEPIRNTNAKVDPLLRPQLLIKSNQTSNLVDLWKLPSTSTTTSSTTRVESINTHQEAWLVVTQSRSLVGELIAHQDYHTGSVLTHGVPHGENLDSSELLQVNAVLTDQSGLALQTLPQTKSSSDEIDLNLYSIIIII